jgi:hypothetical protein
VELEQQVLGLTAELEQITPLTAIYSRPAHSGHFSKQKIKAREAFWDWSPVIA